MQDFYCQSAGFIAERNTNQMEKLKKKAAGMFKEFFCLCKLAIFPAPSVIQLRVPTGILDLEEVGAGLKTGLFPRPASSCPLEAIRFSCQIAGGES